MYDHIDNYLIILQEECIDIKFDESISQFIIIKEA